MTMATYAQHRPRDRVGLKRPNTIRFNARNVDADPEQVYQAINKELESVPTIKCIAHLDSGWYNVSFDNEKDCQQIAQQGIILQGMLMQCERANVQDSVVVYVKVPYEMEDNVVINALMNYGTVSNIRRQHHFFDEQIENGVRSLLIKNIKKPIPSYIRVGSYTLPVRHKGQEKTCRICHQPGHVARQCKHRGRCFICGEQGHRAEHHKGENMMETEPGGDKANNRHDKEKEGFGIHQTKKRKEKKTRMPKRLTMNIWSTLEVKTNKLKSER